MKPIKYLTYLVMGNLLLISPVFAQITPDNTLGAENSRLEQDTINSVDSDIIRGGATRGENLFHSFREFSVEAGRGAYFDNPSQIQNIFTRVTGNSISDIQGVLGVLGEANLFLINPNGIIFGPSARLDIQGSFFASSASSMVFNNFEFSATNPETLPLLTINIPIGLRFRNNPGEINSTENQLTVQPEKTLGLIGGNINLVGSSITATGGEVEIGGLTEAGVITVNEYFNLSYPDGVARSDLSMSNQAVIDVRGEGGGEIRINSNDVNLSNSNIFAGISEEANVPDAVAGDIVIKATGNINVESGFIVNDVKGKGNGGNVEISGNSLEVVNGAQVSANTFGEGDAGNVEIEATGLVRIDREGSENVTGIGSTVGRGAVGNAGGVQIKADSLEVVNGAQVSASTFGEGDAGTITITANRFTANQQGAVNSNTSTTGSAGNIIFSISDTINLHNSNISATTEPDSTGKGGSIIINSNRVNLNPNANITVDSQGQGDSGNISISGNNLTLSNESQISATTASGEGGNISLDLNNFIFLQNNSPISATAGGSGNGGNLTISTNFVIAKDNSNITANAFEGRGGNISLTTQGIFFDSTSQITASSELGVDGVIEINTPDVDPSQGLVELPTTVVDPNQLIAQNPCRNAENSQFIVLGRGGLAKNPAQMMSENTPEVDWIEPIFDPVNTPNIKLPQESHRNDLIIPAQGWISNEDGTITMVGYDSNGARRFYPSWNCYL